MRPMLRGGSGFMIAMVCAFMAPASAWAQSRVPATGALPAPAAPELLEPLPGGFESGVSFLDSAVPRTTVRLRYDYNLFNRRPTRAEYLFPGDGFQVPETRVHSQNLETYVEYGLNEWFSTFMATPFNWINPEQNRNVNGFGDLRFGGKFAGYNTEWFLAAAQLTFAANTATNALTGTGHWSIEPALLANWRLFNVLTLEGQAAYWVPLGGTSFAGDVFKYGAGLSYGGRSSNAIGLMPVVEVLGWTMTSGRELVPTAPGVFLNESAAGDTVINGCAGLRFTLGQSGEIYAGYSHCLSGNPWYRDTIRLELRWFW